MKLSPGLGEFMKWSSGLGDYRKWSAKSGEFRKWQLLQRNRNIRKIQLCYLRGNTPNISTDVTMLLASVLEARGYILVWDTDFLSLIFVVILLSFRNKIKDISPKIGHYRFLSVHSQSINHSNSQAALLVERSYLVSANHTYHYGKSNYLDLMSIGPCIVIYSYSTTNKMHLLSQIIYSCKTLYMFRTVFPSIINSSKLRIQQRYMSNSCCYLLLSGMTWN